MAVTIILLAEGVFPAKCLGLEHAHGLTLYFALFELFVPLIRLAVTWIISPGKG